MIAIDGALGEGGGQVLRTAIALAAARGIPLQIRRIRARRKPPGLRAQHLTAVSALAAVCGADVRGASLGSQELTFVPGPVRPGAYRFDIGSAGATTLVVQAFLLPLAGAGGESRVALTGGTHVPWSPPVDYLRAVLLPELARMGIRAGVEIERWGFFPKGDGRIVVDIAGGAVLSPLTLVHRGGPLAIRGVSVVAGLPRSIAERQKDRALRRLEAAGHQAVIEVGEATASDPGSFLFLTAEGEGGRGGFSSLGARGKRAEAVADEAVDELLAFAADTTGCDPHLADQLVAAFALASGTSRLTTSRVTPHLLTVVALAQQILGCPVQMRGEVGEPGTVTIEGVGGTSGAARGRDATPRASEAAVHVAGAAPARAPLVRKARAADGPTIQKLLAHFAARGDLLHRTLDEIYQHLRDFFVCEADGQVVGVCALWLYWEDLAEVRSLAVLETHGGQGLGKALVEACVEEASRLGIRRVFALTYRPGFFERLGFRTLDKSALPQKIWKDCIQCAKFTCCDEVALIREVGSAPETP
jgi:RNA 3'-phosphate cyclase